MATDKISASDKDLIVSAIKSAEKETSGEIQVHIDNHCKEDVLDRAAHMFKTLKMHQTQERNGVLFYMAIKDKKFAILGDAGINLKVADNFWDNIKEEMASLFKTGKIAEGLSKGIEMAGLQLAQHFPYQSDDENELSDEISFGKD
jgi:uncharacterized membrane protein